MLKVRYGIVIKELKEIIYGEKLDNVLYFHIFFNFRAWNINLSAKRRLIAN